MDKTTKEIICSVCELPIAGDEDYRTDEGGPYHFSDVTCVVRLKERLRPIEAAARALGPGAPIYYDGQHGEYRCRYCDGAAVLLDDITVDHKPDCKWVEFQAALGQGQAGERGVD